MSKSSLYPVAAAGSQIVEVLDRRLRFPASCKAVVIIVYVAAFLLALHSEVSMVKAQPPGIWPTLSGKRPIVIAHGGFSGMYPDSSYIAYNLSLDTGISGATSLWCDLQLTKDRIPICFPSITLDNSSNIANNFDDKSTTHVVDGEATTGYFSVDYTLDDLKNVRLTQGVYRRTPRFDWLYSITTVKFLVEEVIKTRPALLWLNIQHPSFYKSSNLDMTTSLIDLTKTVNVSFISSPDMGFLKKIQANYDKTTTKLVFRFRGEGEKERSTKQTYGSLVKNLKDIKTFASGILVPKHYIWPVDSDNYLLPHTKVVSDAHNLGLQVYASDFMNDAILSFNYSYDPVAEYLNFFDNGDFSVDGVLSDHTVTPADAIDCFSKYSAVVGPVHPRNTLIISKEGASGDYPGCTDLAYKKAIDDGVEILDCPVQMSKDGTPFCLGSINLIDRTTVADQSKFGDRLMNIPEINAGNGIHTFSLTWEEIQTLTPEISNPYSAYPSVVRNPKHKNDGRFVSLSDFLALTNRTSSLTGVSINITNAAYLAEHQGLGVVDAVLDALSKAGYDKKKPRQRVMIQSTSSSVLTKFKNRGSYELVYEIDQVIYDVAPSTLELMTKFAHSVVIKKTSVFPQNNQSFLNYSTSVVPKLQASDLSVYVETFDNEFVSQPNDFFADPTVEMDAYVALAGVDGLVTSFPKTAATYKKNKCRSFISKDYGPGNFIKWIRAAAPEAPSQVLTQSDVAEAPLPPVSDKPPATAGGPEPAAQPSAGSPHGNPFTACLPVLLAYVFFASYLFV